MGTSCRLAQALGHPVAIVDINDLGANILGCSQKEPSMALLARILGTTPWVSPVSAPQWASSAKYDIRARAPEGILRAPLFTPSLS